ncbi:alpha/beta fold hydrolase [Nocardia seriolae]|uniref:Alpha/beta hydrolase n=1 Tax=Nocardia seriolae TaxID=37332 RepID=A0A0B8NEP0_9NOCA|nr:alpha/beta hydrolase [Nocardia seriolae]APA97979.1 Chloride peroxidase [Nocardia seriolae]MTJ62682.1 alpha/beta fold hydrolase [Nocardia seriolae]MTJ74836.1 alpha/beta fold hydrolase [Nocardia seriolae]MTJ87719.1 alpha/beta fold hydrolase [Nocardia seriolae]MTK31712.1 alpha/beta fold hydrolase [Nocardia seriolae]
MSEQTAEVGRGINLTYERRGAGVPLLLIAGLGQQKHEWHDGLVTLLADRGYDVVRFDNRDVGTSTHGRFRPPGPAAMLRKRWDPRQYDLGDMALDTLGLLEELGWNSAHLVGMSMGGMIGQSVAARYPARVSSLTSIFSTTGAARVGRPALSTWARMFRKPARTREEHTDAAVLMYRHIGSAGYPLDENLIRTIAGTTWDRDPHPAAGVGRQLAGILKSGDRTPEVRTITAPTLVLHGDQDRMVNPTGGVVTAAAVPGARLHTLPGMGHDLPEPLWPTLADLIDTHIRTAESRSSDAPNI